MTAHQRARELLLQCQVRLKVESEYQLCKRLQIRQQRINDYLRGVRIPTNYALMRIAECLQIDGFTLICEFEALRALNEGERAYWLLLHSCCKEQRRIHEGQALKAFLAVRAGGWKRGI